MEEILTALLANAAFRTFVEGLVVKLLADILHRRSVDSNFLEKSDLAFKNLSEAKTPEELQIAHQNIQSLLISP